jgi:hypothetical protein
VVILGECLQYSCGIDTGLSGSILAYIIQQFNTNYSNTNPTSGKIEEKEELPVSQLLVATAIRKLMMGKSERKAEDICAISLIQSLYSKICDIPYPKYPSNPAALKGLGKPFDAALEKNLPHPSCPGSSNLPRLFKLPAPLTILAGERCSCCAHIPGPHPLAIQ